MTTTNVHAGYLAGLRGLAGGLDGHANRARERGLEILADELTAQAMSLRAWICELEPQADEHAAARAGLGRLHAAGTCDGSGPDCGCDFCRAQRCSS